MGAFQSLTRSLRLFRRRWFADAIFAAVDDSMREPHHVSKYPSAAGGKKKPS